MNLVTEINYHKYAIFRIIPSYGFNLILYVMTGVKQYSTQIFHSVHQQINLFLVYLLTLLRQGSVASNGKMTWINVKSRGVSVHRYFKAFSWIN